MVSGVCKDGPAPPGECQACLAKCVDDIYFHKGKVLCGGCRYVARHGVQPPRKAPPGRATADDISPWQENCIRQMEDVDCRW